MIIAGENPASHIYVNRKIEACKAVGILSRKEVFPAQISENELLEAIENLNRDPTVDGILVQLPLPNEIAPNKVNLAISPQKDVDGFHPLNMGKLLLGQMDGFIPCTPLGISTLLQRNGLELTGKHAVVLGRSNIVGKPLAALLMQSSAGGNATVTVAHRHTHHLKELCLSADVLIAAIGSPRFVTVDMIKPGAIVVDVGINRIANPEKPQGSQIVGDVDFEAVSSKASWITPVPNGIGPMTIAMLLSNTLKSYEQRL